MFLQPPERKGQRSVICMYCRLTITYDDPDANVVSDLLASHWFDDHHLVSWTDRAADARDRLWRRHPELLERLSDLSEAGGRHPSAS